MIGELALVALAAAHVALAIVGIVRLRDAARRTKALEDFDRRCADEGGELLAIERERLGFEQADARERGLVRDVDGELVVLRSEGVEP